MPCMMCPRIGIVHLEALASCANAKPIIISNPTVSKAEVRVSQHSWSAVLSSRDLDRDVASVDSK